MNSNTDGSQSLVTDTTRIAVVYNTMAMLINNNIKREEKIKRRRISFIRENDKASSPPQRSILVRFCLKVWNGPITMSSLKNFLYAMSNNI